MIRSFSRSPVWRGLTAMSFMRYTTKALTLVRLVFLARWLGPSELGTAGLAFLVLAVSEVFTETGINLVLLKHPKKLSEYLDAAWVVSVLRGLAIAGILIFVAPLIAQVYGDADLRMYIMLGALIPFVRGFIHPAVISFQQELQFGKESAFRLFLQVVDIGIGAILAWQWGSALGLVVGVLISAFVELLFSFILFRPWPSLQKVEWKKVPSLYKETRFMLPHSIFSYLSEHADDFTVGKVLGTTGLGLYQTAYKLISALTLDLSSIVSQTLYPIYARKLAQKQTVRPLWLKATLGLAIMFALMLIPLTFVFPAFISQGLGESWNEIIPILPILFIACAVKAILSSWNPIIILADRTGGLVLVNATLMVSMVLGIILLVPQFSLLGVAYAVLAAMMLSIPYNWWLLHRSLRSLRQSV